MKKPPTGHGTTRGAESHLRGSVSRQRISLPCQTVTTFSGFLITRPSEKRSFETRGRVSRTQQRRLKTEERKEGCRDEGP